ncbi:MAG: DUF6088 family protein [Flavobacteriales bacterium]|nr:DUF6088 family protein [Flavobacteriales bacterium]
MNNTDIVRKKISKLPKGYIFTYETFNEQVKSKEALIKTLNRMVINGEIAKLSKGKFYKPEVSQFGLLEPSHQQIVKDLLEKDSKPLGYLTRLSIYNQLGLSSQNSHIIEIGRNTFKSPITRDIFKIRFVLQKNKITKSNIYSLQILDSLKNLKHIPDTSNLDAAKRLKYLINNLEDAKKKQLVTLSLKYPPATRALLGAILEDLKFNYNELARLKSSLNQITVYKNYNVETAINSAPRWKIQ